jgi:hypothetical protein
MGRQRNGSGVSDWLSEDVSLSQRCSCVAWLVEWEDKTLGAFKSPGWAFWLRCLELWVENRRVV